MGEVKFKPDHRKHVTDGNSGQLTTPSPPNLALSEVRKTLGNKAFQFYLKGDCYMVDLAIQRYDELQDRNGVDQRKIATIQRTCRALAADLQICSANTRKILGSWDETAETQIKLAQNAAKEAGITIDPVVIKAMRTGIISDNINNYVQHLCLAQEAALKRESAYDINDHIQQARQRAESAGIRPDEAWIARIKQLAK